MSDVRRTWSRRLLRAGAFWLIVPWATSGCVELPEQVKHEIEWQRGQIMYMRGQHKTVSRRVTEIEGYLTYCPDEVKGLVGRVEKECETQEYCSLTEADIRVEVRNVAPWAGGRLLSLMQDRKHISLFPSVDHPLTEAEKKRLRDLVQPAWLHDGDKRTRFLVVSHAVDNQAKSLVQASERGKQVIQEIKGLAAKMNQEPVVSSEIRSEPERSPAELPSASSSQSQPGTAQGPAVPASAVPAGRATVPAVPPLPRYLLHWAVPFLRGGEPLRPEDQPRQPSDKLTSSVFVYRVDC